MLADITRQASIIITFFISIVKNHLTCAKIVRFLHFYPFCNNVRPLHKFLYAIEPLIRHIAERQVRVLAGGNDGTVVRKDIESAFPVI